MTAQELFDLASKTLAERGQTYEGTAQERSMAQITKAFNAITKRDLSESEGWLFMCVLKQVRLANSGFKHEDSKLDLVSYAALLGEV